MQTVPPGAVMKRALLVSLTICALGALAWAAVYALELRAATAPPSPTAYVQATWAVYRFGPGHQTHVTDLSLDCDGCHQEAEQHFDRPGPTACVNCHEHEAKIDHALVAVDEQGHALDPHTSSDPKTVAECVRCHGFGPDPNVKADDCLRCHSKAQADVPAVVVHAEQACTTCHDVHDNSVSAIACQTCHKVMVEHGHRDVPNASQCLDCHRVHAAGENAQTSCIECHNEHSKVPVPASAAAHGGAHSCGGCHAPHGFSRAEVQPCQSCHSGQRALPGKGHAECSACHAPHAAGESARLGNVCLSCHRDVQLKHDPSVDARTACTSCHAAHPKSSSTQPADCVGCHREISHDQKSAHAPGVACTGCHAPHAFNPASHAQTACAGCHAQELSAVSKQKGHARCQGCHTSLPHGGVGAPLPCGSCHREQASEVHAGHATCTNCHDAHSGAQEAGNCASCHREQTSHLSKKHGPCQSCHEPHGATPSKAVADCSSCHSKTKLPGLHEVPQHMSRCNSCHQVHATEAPGAREGCLTCHKERVDHQPTATRCDGCHAFRSAPSPRKSP